MTDQTVAYEILQRFNRRPVAIEQSYAMLSLTSDVRAIATLDGTTLENERMARRAIVVSALGLAPVEQRKPFAFSQGVGIIPIQGVLLNRFPWSFSGATGYQFIRSQVEAMMNDDDVKAIVADINSYGGEAAGMSELSREIQQVDKPTLAIVDSNAMSAAYGLAAGFKRIAMLPSGMVGSIGTIMMHIDISEALEKHGIKIDMIYSGKHKADGNPFEPLPKSVRAEFKALCDEFRQDFAEVVAEGRGMDVQDVLATEAQVYTAQDALKLGLVDEAATPRAAMQVFFDGLDDESDSTTARTNRMGTKDSGGTSSQQQQQEDDRVAKADHERAVAAAATEARKAERERMAGIIGCEEAKDKPKLAQHLASNTAMSVEDAKGVLAASASETPPAQSQSQSQTDRFQNAMDNGKHPNVGASDGSTDGQGDGTTTDNENNAQSRAQRILSNQSKITGVPLKAVK